MTAEQVQIRRDTAANLALVTPAAGEPGFDTTNNRLVIGDGSRAGGWQTPNFRDVQQQKFNYTETVGGTANAVTLTYSLATISDAAGQRLEWKAVSTNTGSVTVAVDGRSAVTLQKIKGGTLTNLEAGDIVAGGVYSMVKVGSAYLVTSLGQAAAGVTGLTLLAIATGGGASYNFTSINTSYTNFLFVMENMIDSPAYPQSACGFYMRTRRVGQGSFDSANYDSAVSPIGESTKESFQQGVSAIKLSQETTTLQYFRYGSLSGNVMAHGHGLSAPCKFTGLTSYKFGEPSTALRGAAISGCHTWATAIDGVQFYFSPGNIASGSIYLYGLRRSLS